MTLATAGNNKTKDAAVHALMDKAGFSVVPKVGGWGTRSVEGPLQCSGKHCALPQHQSSQLVSCPCPLRPHSTPQHTSNCTLFRGLYSTTFKKWIGV